MMYIFEGVDHAGKNCLINALQQSREWHGKDFIPIFDGSNVYDKKDCPPIVHDKKEFQRAIGWEVVRFCRQTNTDVIINRFTWSELVYSQVLRGGQDWEWYFNIMEKELDGIAKIIYVYASEKEILSRINQSKRKKSDVIKQSIPDLLNVYDHIIECSSLPIIKVKTDYLDLSDFDYIDKLRMEIFHAE